MMKSKSIAVILSIFTLTLISSAVLANGGDQRVVEGNYIINVARAPFTPRAGEQVSMLISFAHIQTNLLVSDDLIVKIRIAKSGAERTFLFEKDNIKVEGGVLEFPYTFAETGLHEIFIDFAFAKDPARVYESPDFLMDIQPQVSKKQNGGTTLIGVLGGMIGLIIGALIGRRMKTSAN